MFPLTMAFIRDIGGGMNIAVEYYKDKIKGLQGFNRKKLPVFTLIFFDFNFEHSNADI